MYASLKNIKRKDIGYELYKLQVIENLYNS